jgi:predicted transcriptional regulator
MKKIYSITVAAGLALTMAGCAAGNSAAPAVTMKDAAKADVKKMCDVKANGIENVIATAKAYNALAKKEGVEFRRLGVNNSGLIDAVDAGIKSGAKKVQAKNFKGKLDKNKFDINYAAWRACSFGIRAVQQKVEAESTWRLAVPGDGFKY